MTDDYSLTADQGNVWLTGGTEADVIAEAHLDPIDLRRGAAVREGASEAPEPAARTAGRAG